MSVFTPIVLHSVLLAGTLAAGCLSPLSIILWSLPYPPFSFFPSSFFSLFLCSFFHVITEMVLWGWVLVSSQRWFCEASILWICWNQFMLIFQLASVVVSPLTLDLDQICFSKNLLPSWAQSSPPSQKYTGFFLCGPVSSETVVPKSPDDALLASSPFCCVLEGVLGAPCAHGNKCKSPVLCPSIVGFIEETGSSG